MTPTYSQLREMFALLFTPPRIDLLSMKNWGTQIWPIFEVNRLNWQCCLAGSSKTAPRILIFSMAKGANYSFELIFNETCAPQI